MSKTWNDHVWRVTEEDTKYKAEISKDKQSSNCNILHPTLSKRLSIPAENFNFQNFSPASAPVLKWPPHHTFGWNDELLTTVKATLCQARPLKWVTTVPVCPLTSSPCTYCRRCCLHQQLLFVFSVGKKDQQSQQWWEFTVPLSRISNCVCHFCCVSVQVSLSCLSWVKVLFYFTVVAFVENCWLSLLESDLDIGSA